MSVRSRRVLLAGARSLGRGLLHTLTPGAKPERLWSAIGADWAGTLGELKGAAMKLGQLASQYGDVLPAPLAQQLRSLQRSAQPRPYTEMETVLRAEWGPRQWRAVRHVETQALASASIGQVHRARLADGRAVVVKIRYPGVAEAVDDDVRQLRRVLRLGSALRLDAAALDALLEELRQRLREETDYRVELHNLLQLRERAPHPNIHYPLPVPTLCTSAVMVMEECPGADLEQARHWPQEIRDRIGQTLSEWLLLQFFDARVLHADPHPGNFGFLSDGGVVVYDFGCVKQLDAETVTATRHAVQQSLAHDWPALHATLHRLGGLETAADDDSYRHALLFRLRPLYQALSAVSLERLPHSRTFDFSDGSIINDSRQVARRHLRLLPLLRPVPELAFAGRSVSGLYWLLRALGAQVPVRRLLRDRNLLPAPIGLAG